MRKLIFLAWLMVFLSACENGMEVSPGDNSRYVREITLLSTGFNNDGSWTYKMLLPIVWEQDRLTENWDDQGLKLIDGDMQFLYGAENQVAYYWEYTTPNSDVFFQFGHYRYEGEQLVWANQHYSSSIYSLINNGHCFGITFRNGGISRVNPAALVLLQAVIDADLLEIKENRKIRFSGARSTGQASLSSKIIEYHWDFGDGETAKGVVVEHIFTTKGLYNVKLTVTDDHGGVSSTGVIINVLRMSFPVNTLDGGDDYIQVSENRYTQTITIYVNLSLTYGNHGRAFWWGTYNGAGTAWLFRDIKAMPLNEDWGFIEVPFNGRAQYEFNYSDFYEYLDENQRPVGVNWNHMPFSKFYDPDKGHYVILVANQKVTRPY